MYRFYRAVARLDVILASTKAFCSHDGSEEVEGKRREHQTYREKLSARLVGKVLWMHPTRPDIELLLRIAVPIFGKPPEGVAPILGRGRRSGGAAGKCIKCPRLVSYPPCGHSSAASWCLKPL